MLLQGLELHTWCASRQRQWEVSGEGCTGEKREGIISATSYLCRSIGNMKVDCRRCITRKAGVALLTWSALHQERTAKRTAHWTHSAGTERRLYREKKNQKATCWFCCTLTPILLLLHLKVTPPRENCQENTFVLWSCKLSSGARQMQLAIIPWW